MNSALKQRRANYSPRRHVQNAQNAIKFLTLDNLNNRHIVLQFQIVRYYLTKVSVSYV